MTVATPPPQVPDTMGKLTPSDRLVRKRAAARLRQQRCRARKREAVLEERRQQEKVQTPSLKTPNQDSRIQAPVQDPTSVTHYPCSRPLRFIPPRSSEGDYWSDSSSATGPIQNCVSFDSQRSFEEAQRSYERVHGSPMHRNSPTRAPVVSPPVPEKKAPLEVVRLQEKDGAHEAQVAEEEAAAAAMLSLLKTGPSKKPEPSTRTVLYKRSEPPRYRHEMKVPRVTKYRYCSTWDARPRHMERYEYPREGPRLPMRVPEYHPIPPPLPPSLYRYHYPNFDRYN